MQETRDWSLEDPLEKEMETHSSLLDWKIPWTGEPGRLQSMGLQKVRHNWVTELQSVCCPHRKVNICSVVYLLQNPVTKRRDSEWHLFFYLHKQLALRCKFGWNILPPWIPCLLWLMQGIFTVFSNICYRGMWNASTPITLLVREQAIF